MDIHFVSSLNADDENQFAPVLLSAIAHLLDHFALAYMLRIETASSKVFQHPRRCADGEKPPRRSTGSD